MRQAEKAVLGESLMPEDFNREFPIGCSQQNARMKNSNSGDDIRRFLFIPVNRVFTLYEKMILAFVMSDGFGLGLREQQEIHF